MAIKVQNALTLADHAKRLDANGSVPVIVELLNETNAIIDDMLFLECSDGDFHKTTVRTGLPEATWRLLNYGVPKGKSTVASVTDATGMLEVYSEVDKKLADKGGNTNEFRLSESRAFLEGMAQQMASTFMYGNSSIAPATFTGLTSRYSTLDPAMAQSAQNVIDGGGVGADNTSMWLVTYGQASTHGIFPKGSKAGLNHDNLGEQTLVDADGGQYQGYRDHYGWDMGLTVRDWEYNARICNLDVVEMAVDANVAMLKKVLTHMIVASERVKEGGGNKVWYVNKQMRTMLRLAISEKVSGNLTWETVAGNKVMMWDGTPVRLVERLIGNEARVLAAA